MNPQSFIAKWRNSTLNEKAFYQSHFNDLCALDAAVFTAYGWPVDLTEDEILARLLALNLERARC